MGWSEDLGPPGRRGKPPLFWRKDKNKRTLFLFLKFRTYSI